jgi:DNA-binding transcriptional LysR family regulator
MDLRQLGYVVAVADAGSFTGGAAAAGVAQPSLSQAIRALEVELGVSLFDRGGRAGVRLTAAGEALVGPARQCLRDAATARSAVAEVVGVTAGRLDLVCLPSLAVEPVAGLVGRFRRDHPGVAVRIVEPEDAAAVVERVRSGTSEVGFTELPAVGDDLVEVALETHDYVALVPPGRGDLAGDGPIGLRALGAQPLVTTPPGTSTRRVVDDALAAAGLTATVAVETDHREAIAPLVVAGAGVSLLPRRLAATSAAAAGAVVRDVTPPIERSVGLIHRSGTLSPAARAFLAVAAPVADRPPSRPRARRRRVR